MQHLALVVTTIASLSIAACHKSAPPPKQPSKYAEEPIEPNTKWLVYKSKTGSCLAQIQVECKEQACQPRLPFDYGCPEFVFEKEITVATLDGRTCFIESPPCPTGDCERAVTCPRYAPPELGDSPPLRDDQRIIDR